MEHDQRLRIGQILGMKTSTGNGKYMGLPYVIGRSKTEIFAYLKDQIWKKTHGWKETLLSKRGKEILIKSVLQAITTYAMSVFKMPMKLLLEMQCLIKKFWWSSSGEDKGMCWVT